MSVAGLVLFAAITAYNPDLTNFEYPFPVSYYPVRTQNQTLRMAYVDVRADIPNGRTVLLLHGKNFGAWYWESTIRELTKRGYRVIAPDQIGFGKSSKPAAYQFTFHALSMNTRSLLDHLHVSRTAVVGHSMGGMLAMRFALMYPDATEQLVLVNPLGLEDYRIAPYRTVDDSYAQELKATPETIREYMKKSYFDGHWKPDYDKLIEVLAGWTRHPEYARVAWNAALTTDMIITQPVVYEMPRIRVPTLLIIGQRDRTAVASAWAPKEIAAKMGNFPEMGKRAATAISNAKLVEVPAVGHVPQVEAFDTYIDALSSFLSRSTQ